MKARLPKGFGGGPQNQNDAMKQAQKMQEMFAEKQAELDEKEFSVSTGGGVVEVTMNGKKEITKLDIKPEIVDPEDIEMLSDTIMAAVNEVIKKIEDISSDELNKITGNFNIPGLF